MGFACRPCCGARALIMIAAFIGGGIIALQVPSYQHQQSREGDSTKEVSWQSDSIFAPSPPEDRSSRRHLTNTSPDHRQRRRQVLHTA